MPERPEGTSAQTGKSTDDHVRELIGQAIRVRREKAQMSQAEAAEAIGISERTLRDWERGQGSLWTGGDAGTVDLAAMTKLKEIYSCRFAEIMPRNQYPLAPLDPAARREFFWRRNALIQGWNPDEYVEVMREQLVRVRGNTVAGRKSDA